MSFSEPLLDPLGAYETSELQTERVAKKTITNSQALSLTVNYIIGIGVLAMPFIFESAGLVLSLTVLALCSILSYFTVIWVLEAMCRAEALTTAESGQRFRMEISDRMFQVSDMCRIFIGPRALQAYNFVLATYMGFALWGFASASASSLGAVAMEMNIFSIECETEDITATPLDGGCHVLYHCSLLIYGLLVVPLTLMGIKEQAGLQMFMTIYQIVVLLIMVALGIYGLGSNVALDGEPALSFDVETARWGGLGQLVASSVFAQIFHHSIPGLSEPVKNKKDLPLIFGGTLTITGLVYALCGGVLSVYFGEDVLSLATLNFQQINSVGSPSTDMSFAYVVGQTSKYLVLCFPFIGLVSLFSLAAITLGMNLLSGIGADAKAKYGVRTLRIACMLAASLPPLLGAVFVSDLADVLDLAGTLGFFVAFFTPSALQYFSWHRCREELYAKDALALSAAGGNDRSQPMDLHNQYKLDTDDEEAAVGLDGDDDDDNTQAAAGGGGVGKEEAQADLASSSFLRVAAAGAKDPRVWTPYSNMLSYPKFPLALMVISVGGFIWNTTQIIMRLAE